MPDFARLDPEDLFAIQRQPSQVMTLGQPGGCDADSAKALASQDTAWTARRGDGSILACFGIVEHFAGLQGVAWALLSTPVGKDHLALTRFMRRELEASPLVRIEMFAKAAEVETTRAFFGQMGAPVDSGVMVQIAMAEPTPECRWAVMLGFNPAHLLRKFGGASESYMLFERISDAAPAIDIADAFDLCREDAYNLTGERA